MNTLLTLPRELPDVSSHGSGKAFLSLGWGSGNDKVSLCFKYKCWQCVQKWATAASSSRMAATFCWDELTHVPVLCVVQVLGVLVALLGLLHQSKHSPSDPSFSACALGYHTKGSGYTMLDVTLYYWPWLFCLCVSLSLKGFQVYHAWVWHFIVLKFINLFHM